MDEEIGLKTEIVPLSKPFGLYAGNVFQGIVKLDGRPVPYAEVEVEYYNKAGKYTAPTDYMVTQTIKADGNGVFTYAAPKAGWWGFAALNTSDTTKKYKGEESGIPFWLIFDKDGKLLEDSFDSNGQNLGCPATEEEVAEFVSKLENTSDMTEKELEIVASVFRIEEES